MASRFVPVSPRFDHVFGISPELSWCASVALHISKAGSSRFAIKSLIYHVDVEAVFSPDTKYEMNGGIYIVNG